MAYVYLSPTETEMCVCVCDRDLNRVLPSLIAAVVDTKSANEWHKVYPLSYIFRKNNWYRH